MWFVWNKIAGLVPLHLKESQSNVWIQPVDINTFPTVTLYGTGAPKVPSQHQCSAGSTSGGSPQRGRWYSRSYYYCVIISKGNVCASWGRSPVGALPWYSHLCLASASGLRDKGWTLIISLSKNSVFLKITHKASFQLRTMRSMSDSYFWKKSGEHSE